MISKGNYVKFARFVLLAVSEEAQTQFFLFRSNQCTCIIKQLIRFGFCDIQNNQGQGRGYQAKPKAEADNPYQDLDYSGYHKNLIKQLFIK